MKEFFGTVAGIALWIGIFVIAFGAGTVMAVAAGILGLVGVILFWKYLHGKQQERMYKESLSFAAAERHRKLEEQEKQLQEEQRITACQEVLQWFAVNLGHINKQVVTNQELSEWMQAGITPEALVAEMGRRVEKVDDGVLLGYLIPVFQANVNLTKVNVKLAQEYRDRHTYIIGKSGSGKTNLLRNLIHQDLEAGNGLGVIAPEHEMLTEEILPFIPDGRVGDVVYVNPADDQPVCFNPLQLDPGEDPDVKVGEVFTIFNRLMGESGVWMDRLLHQSLAALIGRPGATLLDIDRLLDRSDNGFRNEIMRDCQDEQAARFWREQYLAEFPKHAHLPLTNRLSRLLGPKSIRAMLCTPGRSLNFQQCMDDGQVMLFNLSDGLLGEQNSQLLGQLVVSKFQLAVMARARQPKAERRNFYLYIDEFQTFTGTAGVSYEKILSRARKYRLGLILAHQQTGQIPGSLLKEIMGNVSTTICFALSGEDARKFSKEFIITDPEGEAGPLPEEEILRLPIGEAWCKVGQHAFRLHTHRAPEHGSSKRAAWVIQESRRRHGSRAAVAGQGGIPRAAAGSNPRPDGASAGAASGKSEEEDIFE